MAGYGLTQRAASNVRISGLCADPFKVIFNPCTLGLLSDSPCQISAQNEMQSVLQVPATWQKREQ